MQQNVSFLWNLINSYFYFFWACPSVVLRVRLFVASPHSVPLSLHFAVGFSLLSFTLFCGSIVILVSVIARNEAILLRILVISPFLSFLTKEESLDVSNLMRFFLRQNDKTSAFLLTGTSETLALAGKDFTLFQYFFYL